MQSKCKLPEVPPLCNQRHLDAGNQLAWFTNPKTDEASP